MVAEVVSRATQTLESIRTFRQSNRRFVWM